MSPPDLSRFRRFLADHYPRQGFDQEVLAQDLGATIHRRNHTGKMSGLDQMNTAQIATLISLGSTLDFNNFMREAFILSAAIDGDLVALEESQACGLIPDSWTWFDRARHFDGGADELLQMITSLTATRERCAAACLAAQAHPGAVDRSVVSCFLRPHSLRVANRLLRIGLTGANGQALADYIIKSLPHTIEALIADSLDELLATAVEQTRVADVAECLLAHPRVIGDRTRLALAERALRHGDPAAALQLANGCRMLSPTYPRIVLVGTLASIDIGNWQQAKKLVGSIDDPIARERCRARIAQATGDTAAELDALVTLQERQPDDPATFVQLLRCLQKVGSTDLAVNLCLSEQERFLDEPDVMRIIATVIERSR